MNAREQAELRDRIARIRLRGMGDSRIVGKQAAKALRHTGPRCRAILGKHSDRPGAECGRPADQGDYCKLHVHFGALDRSA